MIRRTFQLVSGVGPWREKDLWARGIEDWDALRARGADVLPPAVLEPLLRAVDSLEEALARRDVARMAAAVPSREHWRLWPHVSGRASCLDLEADAEGALTVAGLLDADGLATFVAGATLDDLPARLAASDVWVTFNGSCFDLPLLRRRFPELPAPALHLDLRVACRRVGLPGGLKSLEARLGIARPPHLRGRDGMDAILLWRAFHQTGDVEALRFLVEYNLYDAFQLRAVADHAFNQGARRLAWPDQVMPWERGEVLYDLSRLLLALEPPPRDLGVPAPA